MNNKIKALLKKADTLLYQNIDKEVEHNKAIIKSPPYDSGSIGLSWPIDWDADPGTTEGWD